MTAPETAPDHDLVFWRVVDLLSIPCDIAIIETPMGDSVLHPDTIAKLAELIAGDAELARLYRAAIWAGESA